MDFVLTYQGELGTKRKNATAKQELREVFAKQLDVLWLRPELESIADVWTAEGHDGFSLVESVGDYHYAPLVHSRLALLAELDIYILRPGREGNLIGYDLDNRLKILFDALRCPQQSQEIPDSVTPSPVENPMKVLLEDDRLITGLNVHTSELLNNDLGKNHVDLRIKVTLKASRRIYANMILT